MCKCLSFRKKKRSVFFIFKIENSVLYSYDLNNQTKINLNAWYKLKKID